MTVTLRYALPHDQVLVDLLHAARRKGSSDPIIRDDYGFTKTYADLLGDVIELRQRIKDNLPPDAFDQNGLLEADKPYICVMTRGGYEFLVGFFATRALGGACVPLGSGILPEEADYFLSTVGATCLLLGQVRSERATAVEQHLVTRDDHDTVIIHIPSDSLLPIAETDVVVNDALHLDPRGPGLVMFTSGSTGPPKGAVLPRESFHTSTMILDSDACCACDRPPQWIAGVNMLVKPVIQGARLHVLRERAGPGVVWDLFRDTGGDITMFRFTAALLRSMKHHYLERIAPLPLHERDEYVRGLSSLAAICGGGSALDPATRRFWTDLTGLPFVNAYGMTETAGGVTSQGPGCSRVEDSIGAALPGVEIKLSNGDHGEILCKSKGMMTHYVGNEKASRAAFDDDGYLKTGDNARLQDSEYVFEGRATADYVFFNGFRISIIAVEAALAALPYVREAFVMGVADHESKELCAALVRVGKGSFGCDDALSLARLRSDLSPHLATYQLPVLLRLLDGDEQIPRTPSQKPVKPKMRTMYFLGPGSHFWEPDSPTPRVQSWGSAPAQVAGETRPWDWGGLQRDD